jgi:hypothetical protein
MDATEMLHPWLSMIDFTVVRPRPNPCSRREFVPR